MTSHVETIVRAYVEEAGGDAETALRQAICDALADLTEAERRLHRTERLLSRGYVRGRVGAGAPAAGAVVPSPRERGEG